MNDGYLGDLAKTQIIDQLVKIPRHTRTHAWETKFLTNLPDASFACGDPQVVAGPDGFNYFQLQLPKPNTQFECYVLNHMKDDFLLEQGLGVVINNNPEDQPDWVLSYGDIVNLDLHQSLFMPEKHDFYKNPQRVELQPKGKQAMMGAPSDQILPPYLRKILRSLFHNIGFENPKVLLVWVDQQLDIYFNITPDWFENPDYFQGFMQSIAWHLPRYYTFAAIGKASDWQQHFVDL